MERWEDSCTAQGQAGQDEEDNVAAQKLNVPWNLVMGKGKDWGTVAIQSRSLSPIERLYTVLKLVRLPGQQPRMEDQGPRLDQYCLDLNLNVTSGSRVRNVTRTLFLFLLSE